MGYHYIWEENSVNSEYVYHGGYGMIGPALFIGSTGYDRSHLFIEMLGGTSTNGDIGLIATARIGATFCLPNRIVFSAHFGSIYMSLKPVSRMLSAADEFNFITGFSMGYRF